MDNVASGLAGSDARLTPPLEEVLSSSSLGQVQSFPSVSTASTSDFALSTSISHESLSDIPSSTFPRPGSSHRRVSTQRQRSGSGFSGSTSVTQGRNRSPTCSEEDGDTEIGTSFSQTLPMCPADQHCMDINDPLHQNRYMHTCKLFPCYHAHLAYHVRLFRHVAGQGNLSPVGSFSGGTFGSSNSASNTFNSLTDQTHMSGQRTNGSTLWESEPSGATTASMNSQDENGGMHSDVAGGHRRVGAMDAPAYHNKSVGGAHQRREDDVSSHPATNPSPQQPNRGIFSVIGSTVPNATPLEVHHESFDMRITIHADWTALRLHTLRRYLQQKMGIPPQEQELVWKGAVLEDDVSLMCDLLGGTKFESNVPLLLRTSKGYL